MSKANRCPLCPSSKKELAERWAASCAKYGPKPTPPPTWPVRCTHEPGPKLLAELFGMHK